MSISGLKLIHNFITTTYEAELIKNIKKEKWNSELSRKTQHYSVKYGNKLWKYNYGDGKVILVESTDDTNKDTFLNQKSLSCTVRVFPPWLQTLINYIVIKADIRAPDQVIINEYRSGQGIDPHVDSLNFDSHICSLSLGSDIIVRFQKDFKLDYSKTNTIIPIKLYKRSFLEMTGNARYKWKHGISKTKKDGDSVRGTRYSITFRKVIKDYNLSKLTDDISDDEI